MQDRDEEQTSDQNLTHPPPRSHLWLWMTMVGIVIIIVVLAVLVPMLTQRDDPTQLIPTPVEPTERDEPQSSAPAERERPVLPAGSSRRIETH